MLDHNLTLMQKIRQARSHPPRARALPPTHGRLRAPPVLKTSPLGPARRASLPQNMSASHVTENTELLGMLRDNIKNICQG